jgi:hypothetical protein
VSLLQRVLRTFEAILMNVCSTFYPVMHSDVDKEGATATIDLMEVADACAPFILTRNSRGIAAYGHVHGHY